MRINANRDINGRNQCCGNCRFFTEWDETVLGICSWDTPLPAHVRRCGSDLRIDHPGHDFGEECPAWEKGIPKSFPIKQGEPQPPTESVADRKNI